MSDFNNSPFTRYFPNDSPDFSDPENFCEPNILPVNDFISTPNLKEYYKNDIYYNGEFPILNEDYIKEQSQYKTNVNNFKDFEESSILFVHDPISKKYKEWNFNDVLNLNKEKINEDIFQENFHEKDKNIFEIRNEKVENIEKNEKIFENVENFEKTENVENIENDENDESDESDENESAKIEKEIKKPKDKKKKVKKKHKKNINNKFKLNNEYKKNLFEVFNVFNPKMGNEYYKFKKENNSYKNYEPKEIKDLINEAIKKNNQKLDNISSLKNEYKPSNENDINNKKIAAFRKRKHKPDDIRKKIKSRFLKSLKNTINNKLECANSEKLFDFLPQCFICTITKKRNDLSVLNMTFKKLMSTDFYEEYNNETDTNNLLKKKRNLNSPDKQNYKNPHKKIILNPDKKKYLKNIDVLNYLENNSDIRNKVNFDIIKNMTFSDLYNEYLKSKEFEDDIMKLKSEENENEEYIKDYIVKANDYIKYFSNSG